MISVPVSWYCSSIMCRWWLHWMLQPKRASDMPGTVIGKWNILLLWSSVLSVRGLLSRHWWHRLLCMWVWHSVRSTYFRFSVLCPFLQQLQASRRLHQRQVQKRYFSCVWCELVFIFSNPKTGSCLEAGFDSCCDPTVAVNCFGYPPMCYCDEVCYDFGDCCGDVAQAGCIGMPQFVLVCLTTRSLFPLAAPSVQPTVDHGKLIYVHVQLPPSVLMHTSMLVWKDEWMVASLPRYIGSCAGLNYQGCCVPSQDEQCLGDDGECYCDVNCHYFGDCCDDIEEIGCGYRKFCIRGWHNTIR